MTSKSRLSAVATKPAQAAGFSLVEMLVGVAIGLIGIVIMFQMLENWETRKRTTGSGSDAQISGSIAMYRIESDIHQAGFGFGTSNNLGCPISAHRTPASGGVGNFSFPMVPVQITHHAGAPDDITVLYGDAATMSATLEYTASNVAWKKTANRVGISKGDKIIVVESAASCGLVEITGINNADNLTVDHGTANYLLASGNTKTPEFNSAAGLTPVFTAGELYNLGFNPARNTWRIVNLRTLQVKDELLSNSTAEVGEGIVDLQAQYGLDTNNDTVVDVWQAADPANWTQLRAIRIALLARSQQYEKATVLTNAAPSWAGGAFTMKDVNGNAASNDDTPNDWRHYRYRVYQSVIPLRNMLWGTAP
jgi:type IV pilus assembly protein PilW